MLKLIRIMSFILLILLPFPILAGTGLPVEQRDAIQVVQSAIEQSLNVLRQDPERARQDPNFSLEVIREKMLPVIDVEGMVRLILARHWRNATQQQQERLVIAFQETMLLTYGSQLGRYLDREVNIIPRRSRQDERMAVVYSEIVLGSGQPNLVVQYRLRPVDGLWRIFDVEAEGLSLVNNFRTVFNAEINQNGIERLLERLESADGSLVEEVISGYFKPPHWALHLIRIDHG